MKSHKQNILTVMVLMSSTQNFALFQQFVFIKSNLKFYFI